MKTQKEIEKQIEALKEIRPKVRPYSAFGDNNLDQLDAQVRVLKDEMDSTEIFDKFEFASEEVLSAAMDAREWIDGQSDTDDLVTDWPLQE